MPVTLAQAKVGMADHIDQQVIDEFRRGSYLLDNLTFDNAVSPGTGGSTLVYGYTRLKTPAAAAFRDINTEYTANEADRENKTVELKIFGGDFAVDRVIAQTANGQINEVQFQLSEKIKATTNLFHYTAINGDKSVAGFDGLDTMLVGTSTELNADAANAIDLSTASAIDANYKTVLDALDQLMGELDGTPTLLVANNALITKLRACARRAGYMTQSEDAFGRKISGYAGIPFVDFQYFYNPTTKAEEPVIPIVSRSITSGSNASTATGLTDLYAIRLGLDGFHAVSPAGGKIINTTLPDFSTAGAVKHGDVEMVAATVLKKTRAAGVLRNFKVK
ncbi:MAG: phage capsid protein [Eubacteriales bacterium]|nr:phage capsid protein [Eubacteriales bacterium]